VPIHPARAQLANQAIGAARHTPGKAGRSQLAP
jgi:hypothetical protein